MKVAVGWLRLCKNVQNDSCIQNDFCAIVLGGPESYLSGAGLLHIYAALLCFSSFLLGDLYLSAE